MSFFWRHRAKGIFEDGGYLVPINFRRVEEHPHPIPKVASRTSRRLEESLWFGTNQFLLNAKQGRAPQRYPAIAAVVVVVVAERPRAVGRF